MSDRPALDEALDEATVVAVAAAVAAAISQWQACAEEPPPRPPAPGGPWRFSGRWWSGRR